MTEEKFLLEFCEGYELLGKEVKERIRYASSLYSEAKERLRLIHWKKKYGIVVSNGISYDYFKFIENTENTTNFISWEDDDRVPSKGWYLIVRFPAGAYILGDDYDELQILFKKMLKEIKSYDPDYIDSVNKSFYWKIENARPMHENIREIFNKYRMEARGMGKEIEIMKLENKLKQLKK